MSKFIKEMDPPKETEGDCWKLVMIDMEARRLHGIEKYGVPVQINSGRDGLIDLYQELLDACVYIRKLLEEKYQEKSNEQP